MDLENTAEYLQSQNKKGSNLQAIDDWKALTSSLQSDRKHLQEEVEILSRQLIEAERKLRKKEERERELEEAASKSQQETFAAYPDRPFSILSSIRDMFTGLCIALSTLQYGTSPTNKEEYPLLLIV